jgi:hypothetical protein
MRDGLSRLGTRTKATTCRGTIERELEVLIMALRHAKGCGKWSSDLDNIIPSEFKPPPAKKGDSITRKEAVRIFPRLLADPAAAMAFSLATGAERSALGNALREDIPRNLSTCREILVRGTKNDGRFDLVSIVTDEQRLLLAYAKKHSCGTNGKLSGRLHNIWRDLHEACVDEKITPVSSHDLRRSAGQWMIDLKVPIEVVSIFMRHEDIATTQRWYAKIRKEDVADRLLDSLDPRLAKKSHRARGKKKLVETITCIPEPRRGRDGYEVNGVRKSLDAWAEASGIPKTTLFYRVEVKKLSMADALAAGPSTKKKRQHRPEPVASDCATGVTVSMDASASNGQDAPSVAEPTLQSPAEIEDLSARHRGFEPLTYGSGGREASEPTRLPSGALRNTGRIAPVVVLFPGRYGSPAVPSPHEMPHAGGDGAQHTLARLDRSNPEHVRAVVEWLAQVSVAHAAKSA